MNNKFINIPFWDIWVNSTTSWAMSSIHDPRYKILIEELIKMRELKNITQVELATSLKKPQSYIAKVETLERRIDILELYDWLLVLGVPISDFLKISLVRHLKK